MKLKFAATIALSLAVMSPVAAWSEIMVVATDRANVRSLPSTKGSVLGVATRGLRVREVLQENGWSKVEISKGAEVFSGWIKSDLLKAAGAGLNQFSRPDLDKTTDYQTDFGILTEQRRGLNKRYFFANSEIDVENWFLVSGQSQFGNHFLMTELGGAICPQSFRWLTVSENGVKMTARFGTCMERYEVTEGEGWIEMEIPSPTGQIERYRYDGNTVELRVIDKPEPVVENSMDPFAWVGKSAYDYLSSSTTENYLLGLMSLLDLERISRNSMSEVQPFTEDGDWIVAVGRFEYIAMARYQGVAKVLIALSKETNEAFIHFVEQKENGALTTQFWGKKPENLTGVMRRAMSR